MEIGSKIDIETCERCGLCVAVCPNGIPIQVPDRDGRAAVALRAERLHLCIRCGHCMATCPSGAISIDGLSCDEHIFDLPAKDVDGDAFFDLLASRRSIRTFKDTPVPRELLQEIVEAIATAIGLVPWVVERSLELRELFQIPPENEVLASMIVGYPRHRFKRGIRRELAGVHWI